MIAQVRRSTELGLIVLAAIITGRRLRAGRRSAAPPRCPPTSAPFLVVILGLLIAAHLATRVSRPRRRRRAPARSPRCSTGSGYVFIARVDTDLAGLQATWTFVGIGAYVATLLVVRRVRDLARYKWTFALFGIVLLMLPFVPGVGFAASTAPACGCSLGPINFQPGEFAKIALALFFAAYLVERRELLAAGTWKVGPFQLPEPRHLGPLLIAWAASLVVMIGQKDLGSSLLFFALFVVMLWVGHRARELPGHRRGALRRRLVRGLERARHTCRTGSTSGSTRGADARRQGLPDRPEHLRPGLGGLTGTGLGLGDPEPHPGGQERLHLRRRR